VYWLKDFRRIAGEQPCVLVTLILVSGSAPRESGARMIVTRDAFTGSIGGGNLEFQAIGLARELLETEVDGARLKKLVGLGPELNQCCGGAVALFYEVHRDGPPGWAVEGAAVLESGDEAVLAMNLDQPASGQWVVIYPKAEKSDLPREIQNAAEALLQTVVHSENAHGSEVETEAGNWWLEPVRVAARPVMLFGAGHVGQAVARALAPLPFDLTWVDSREGAFPEERPGRIRTVSMDDPASLVVGATPATIFVVMTHSHQLDEDICFQVLQRNDFAWLGLIGSETKRRRFVHRLENRGIPATRLKALVCPIGLTGIRGKQPATIALSLAAQLMMNNGVSNTWTQENN